MARLQNTWTNSGDDHFHKKMSHLKPVRPGILSLVKLYVGKSLFKNFIYPTNSIHEKARYFLLLSLFLWCFIATGQLSPGPLSNAHSKLEGLSNCTKCHEIGNKVTNQKCLNCHDEIKRLIDQKKGYHSSIEVRGKDCAQCHSDHHGLKFDMVRFDEEKFNHNLAGYKLEGAHAQTDCRSCHAPANITNTSLKKKTSTFLGLKTNCTACHEDFHENNLSQNCLECHDFNDFKKASKFRHDKTDFPLKGAHIDLECNTCHKETFKNGQKHQLFAKIPFKDCNDCHSDPHNGHINTSCSVCHSETSFSNRSKLGSFNHNSTPFPLNGKHKSAGCFDCHTYTSKPGGIFQDRLGTTTNNCAACHKDVHEQKFGNDCASCHSEQGFSRMKNPDLINHDNTDFPLVGNHTKVDCKSCHTKNLLDPIQHDKCSQCHKDYHEGVFVRKNPENDCNACHSINSPFTETTYNELNHARSSFPLEGSHLAIPCLACHFKTDKWVFEGLGTDCKACHDDVHKEDLDQKYRVEKSCKFCHNAESWQLIEFDHKETGWPLDGAHEATLCGACHKTNNSTRLKLYTHECQNCHKSIHGDQFEENGQTTCAECHQSISWLPSIFNHATTDFPLVGKHKEISCNDCHKTITNDIRIYSIPKHDCKDCHSQ